MSDNSAGPQPQNTRAWLIATALAGLAVIALAAWGVFKSKEATELAQSLLAAQQQLSQTQGRLHDTEAKLAAAAEQLQSSAGQLAAASKPDLPVSVSFRAALLGSGLVAIFRNQSSSPIEVAAEFSSKATGAKRSANLVLEPNLPKQIGHAEGWPFAAGQHIRLTNHEFRSLDYDVPGT